MATKFFIKVNKENKDLLHQITELILDCDCADVFTAAKHRENIVIYGDTLEDKMRYLNEVPQFKQIGNLVEAANDGSGCVFTQLFENTGFDGITVCGAMNKTHVRERSFENCSASLKIESPMVLDVYFEGDKEADVAAVLGADLCAKFGITDGAFNREYDEFTHGATHYWVTLPQWDTITLADIKVMKELIAEANERIASIGAKATYLNEAQVVEIDGFDILAGDICGAEYISEDGSKMLEINFSSTGINDVDFRYYE